MMDADDTVFKKIIPHPAGSPGISGPLDNGVEEDWLAYVNQ